MERRLVTRPYEIGQIIGIGRNYRREGLRPEDYPAVPKIFLKSLRSIIRTGEAIVITPANGRAPDYDVIAEPELGVYLSRGGRNIGIAEAMDYVAGVTVLNDVTDRIRLKEDGGEWTRGISQDTFLPLSDKMLTGVPYGDLEVICRVNGEERARESASKLIFPVAELISFISRSMTLREGDLGPDQRLGYGPYHGGSGRRGDPRRRRNHPAEVLGARRRKAAGFHAHGSGEEERPSGRRDQDGDPHRDGDRRGGESRGTCGGRRAVPELSGQRGL